MIRFNPGDRISWFYGSTKPTFGTIRHIKDGDALDGETGEPVREDGVRYGRHCFIECHDRDCTVNCHTGKWLHCCCESQLTLNDGALPDLGEDSGALF